MNKQKTLSILTIFIFCLFSSYTYGRKPAVEPVMGISIEEYQKVEPTKARSFNWQTKKAAKLQLPTPEKIAKAPKKNPIENSTSPYFLLGLLAALPFVLWIGIMKGLPGEQSFEDNTIEFPTQDNSDDDINYPKAS